MTIEHAAGEAKPNYRLKLHVAELQIRDAVGTPDAEQTPAVLIEEDR